MKFKTQKNFTFQNSHNIQFNYSIIYIFFFYNAIILIAFLPIISSSNSIKIKLNVDNEGEIPLVIYEALDDYFNGKQDMSEHFAEKMKSLVNLYGWNEETVYKENFGTDIYYSDGQIQHVNIEYGNNEDLSEETDLVYTENDESLYSKIIYFIEIDGEEHMIHMNHIAMIVMPLLTVEETINKLYL